MKPLLLHPDRDFDLEAPIAWNADALVQDLGLETLLRSLSRSDRLTYDVSRRVLLSAFSNDPGTIRHRQAVLKDCLKNAARIRDIHALTVEALEARHKQGFLLLFGTKYPVPSLYAGRDLLGALVPLLVRLRDLTRVCSPTFESPGFRTLFATLERELSEEYLDEIRAHLAVLEMRHGTLMSAQFGDDAVGKEYVLHRPTKNTGTWWTRLRNQGPPSYTFELAPRDEAGARILSEMHDRGILRVAQAVSQSAQNVEGFFRTLQLELAFYIGCLNVHEDLERTGEGMCFPGLETAPKLNAVGLYDLCLSLEQRKKVVPNDCKAGEKPLVIITGANRGGKSSFLRSVGVATMMMQAGMFVPAETFASSLRPGLVTHYKREEDASLKSGKFDDELVRLSEIVDHIPSGTLLLFNESFASTNEREGSDTASTITRAMLEGNMTVFFVTHLHTFAYDWSQHAREQTLFLRAEVDAEGQRTFRLVEGEPRKSASARDLFERIFQGEERPR